MNDKKQPLTVRLIKRRARKLENGEWPIISTNKDNIIGIIIPNPSCAYDCFCQSTEGRKAEIKAKMNEVDTIKIPIHNPSEIIDYVDQSDEARAIREAKTMNKLNKDIAQIELSLKFLPHDHPATVAYLAFQEILNRSNPIDIRPSSKENIDVNSEYRSEQFFIIQFQNGQFFVGKDFHLCSNESEAYLYNTSDSAYLDEFAKLTGSGIIEVSIKPVVVRPAVRYYL